jgi:hypothetical protein
MRCSITLCQFAKRTQITCGNKVIGYPLDPIACGNRDACNAVNVSNIPLGELNFN